MSTAKVTGIDAQVGDRKSVNNADFHLFEFHGGTLWGTVGCFAVLLLGVFLLWRYYKYATKKKMTRYMAQLPPLLPQHQAITYQHPAWHGQPQQQPLVVLSGHGQQAPSAPTPPGPPPSQAGASGSTNHIHNGYTTTVRP